MKKTGTLIIFIALLCVIFTTCDNPVMKKWWVEDDTEDYYYVPIMKLVPEIYYEQIIQDRIVYETVYEKVVELLPAEIIYQYIYVELPPKVIYEIVHEVVYKETTIEVIKLEEVEVVVTEYITLPPTPPNKDTIIEWLNDPENANDVKEIIKVIKKYLTVDDIKEIIASVDPAVLIEYLTNEQKIYIITQQSPEKFLQSLTVISIEYVIFAGNSASYNGPALNGGTNLTSQLIGTNNNIVTSAAHLLFDNFDKNYMVLLHGHANPVENTPQEIADLMELSTKRAESVEEQLKKELRVLKGVPTTDPLTDLSTRISTEGYGGESNIAAPSSSNAELNRRVEVIVIKIDTSKII